MGSHDRFIQRALDIASSSTHRWQLGCIIIRNGNVLSRAVNKFRNPPHIDHLNASQHAEMAALARCLLSGPRSYYLRGEGEQLR
jgi:pyrimidine deaminase RibD-like protein